MKHVTIMGDGGWGTAIGLLLQRKGMRVCIWGPFPDYIEQIRRQRVNSLYLPGVTLPEELRWTADREIAMSQAELVVLAMPSRYYRAVLGSFAGLIPDNCDVVSVSKGLDAAGNQRLSVVAQDLLRRESVAVLSGPSHAEETARNRPAAVVLACADMRLARRLQKIFMTPQFRVYTSDDVIGVELGGALKNIMAIAAGISDGLGMGDNARAALITRGLAEMCRLGVALGARAETFAGLSGMGDLIVTCSSRLSRNHQVGERLGRGETLTQICAGMKQVAEGLHTVELAWKLARRLKTRTPIINEIHALLRDKKQPADAMRTLLCRSARQESG